jgi:YebC/PmpR family DNA-binding regulatory protein
MSGHSKWSTIKHKKAAIDAKRGKIFSKLAKEIMVCARQGGGDTGANITLRTLVAKARAVNMPADNIERAIKKGTGELEGAAMEEVMYEGYAPGGVAIIAQVLTDNRNRSASEVRHAFTKYNCSLAGQGSVSRSFNRKGVIRILTEKVSEDALLEKALEAGAEDMSQQDEVFEIITGPSEYPTVLEALQAAGVEVEESEMTLLPETYMPVADKGAASTLLSFVEALEELDDVQNVYSNFDISDELMEKINAEQSG